MYKSQVLSLLTVFISFINSLIVSFGNLAKSNLLPTLLKLLKYLVIVLYIPFFKIPSLKLSHYALVLSLKARCSHIFENMRFLKSVIYS